MLNKRRISVRVKSASKLIILGSSTMQTAFLGSDVANAPRLYARILSYKFNPIKLLNR
jgi:hypothetical protein